MPLSDFITLNVTTNTATVSAIGFGMPLLLSASANWTERTRVYTSATGVAADFAVGTAEYTVASQVFSQKPRPPKVMIGRLAHKPTMSWLVVPTAVNLGVYRLEVDGHVVSVTADADATAAEIVSALKTAIDALSLAITTSGTATLIITATAAGAWHQVASLDIAKLDVSQTMTDAGGSSGIADDMNAIVNENNEWFAILNPYASKSIITALAAWTQAQPKMYLASTQDTASATAAPGGSDVMQTLESANYTRTSVWYHEDNGVFLAESLAGARLPKKPGSETWKFAELTGVPASNLTATQQANIRAKHGNFYYDPGDGKGMTTEGWTAGSEFIDTMRGIDWLSSRIQSNLIQLLRADGKVPQTNPGAAQVQGAVMAALLEGVDAGLLKASPAPECTVPDIADVPDADLSNRNLPDVAFTAKIAGATHSITVNGNVSI